MKDLILPAVICVCGAAWIYIAADNEESKAVTGNGRHFLKVASPGVAAIVIGIALLFR
jgi:hypothetical protein